MMKKNLSLLALVVVAIPLFNACAKGADGPTLFDDGTTQGDDDDAGIVAEVPDAGHHNYGSDTGAGAGDPPDATTGDQPDSQVATPDTGSPAAIDSGPSCTAATCPNGCCANDKCIAASDASCGTAGGVCSDCAASNQVCTNGTCGAPPCDATTCASGCCSGNKCMPGTTTSACGTGGGACKSCGSGKSCTSAGTCGTVKTCSQATCPYGCCDTSGTCQSGTTDTICGNYGDACVDCTAQGASCDIVSGVCL